MRAFTQFLVGEIRQIQLEQPCRALCIGKSLERVKIRRGKLRDERRDKQSAVRRNALRDRLCAADCQRAVSCAVVYHTQFLLMIFRRVP